MKKKFRFFLKLFIVAAICAPAYYGWQEWKRFEPVLDVLQKKDPEKYEIMVLEFKDYHFDKAEKLYDELDAMTENQVVMLRFNKLKKKWHTDKEFQFESMKERHLFRKKHKERMKGVHKNRARIAEHFGDDKAEWLPVAWKNMEPWKKSEMLREKCVQYLREEIEEDYNRKSLRDIPRHTALLKKSGTVELTPAKLCEGWVPLSQDENVLRRSVQKLKGKLGYSSYKKMLEQLGIPVDQAFPFPSRFNRLTAELTG